MTVEELKQLPGYSAQVNLSDDFADKIEDVWGAAFVWVGDKGAEYNFSTELVDGEKVSNCAIYKIQMDTKADEMRTDYSEFIHYDVDFSHANWMDELIDAMCNAVISFHYTR